MVLSLFLLVLRLHKLSLLGLFPLGEEDSFLYLALFFLSHLLNLIVVRGVMLLRFFLILDVIYFLQQQLESNSIRVIYLLSALCPRCAS